MPDPDPRIAKLPKWAQDVIDSKTREVQHLLREIESARASTDENTRIFIRGRFLTREVDTGDHPIPESRIRFNLGETEHHWMETAIRGDDDPYLGTHLEVRAERGIIVIPSSSNSLRLYPEGRMPKGGRFPTSLSE
jgi:hypothetical protein